MIIASSNVALASQHILLEQESRQESLKLWRDGAGGQTGGAVAVDIRQDQLSISAQAQNLLAAQAGQSSPAVTRSFVYELSDRDKERIALIERMLEMLTSKKVRLRVLDPAAWARRQEGLDPQFAASVQTVRPAAQSGGGMIYEQHTQRLELEKTAVQAAGTVTTADGRSIRFAMDVSMSRQFAARVDTSIRAGAALTDPLVLNLSGAAGDLTEQKYSFDIDADGDAEQISFAGPGSGFLALDRNGDGVINDGGELFGTQSGNGFRDLSEFDADGNGWIDEADPVFRNLRIWQKDAAGQDQLVALGQAGVGALYLGNVASEFAVKDSANTLQGQVRSSGMFLRENGSAGVLQQIDIAV